MTGALADTDAEMVFNRGVHLFDSAIKIIKVTYFGDPVPDNSDLTLDELIAGVPPWPLTTEALSLAQYSLRRSTCFVDQGLLWRRPHHSESRDRFGKTALDVRVRNDIVTNREAVSAVNQEFRPQI